MFKNIRYEKFRQKYTSKRIKKRNGNQEKMGKTILNEGVKTMFASLLEKSLTILQYINWLMQQQESDDYNDER